MRANGNQNVETVVVARAGHHVYLDNPEKVNELLMEELGKPRPSIG
jgi:cardiolipin-specific phospholipase